MPDLELDFNIDPSYMNWNTNPMGSSSPSGNCLEQGKVECPDGSCVDQGESCYDREGTGRLPYPNDFIDDPTTKNIEEDLEFIYEQIGGEDWTDLTYDEWKLKFGDEFTSWEGSIYEKQFNLLDQQLGMIPDLMKLKAKEFALEDETIRFGAEGQLDTLRGDRESLIRSLGGLDSSGQAETRVKSTYEKIAEGFDLKQAALDVKVEGSALDFENKVLQGEFDLAQVIANFQDTMWGQIAMKKEGQKAAESTCPEGQVECINEDGGSYCVDSSEGCPSGEDYIDVGDQIPGNEDIMDEESCTQLCVPYAGLEGEGGMNCYDSCLGTPTMGAGQFHPQNFAWIDRAEADRNCDGETEWNLTTGELDCKSNQNEYNPCTPNQSTCCQLNAVQWLTSPGCWGVDCDKGTDRFGNPCDP